MSLLSPRMEGKPADDESSWSDGVEAKSRGEWFKSALSSTSA